MQHYGADGIKWLSVYCKRRDQRPMKDGLPFPKVVGKVMQGRERSESGEGFVLGSPNYEEGF